MAGTPHPRRWAGALTAALLCSCQPAPTDHHPTEGALTLAFGGDVILGRRLNRILHGPPPQPWGPARETLRGADITLVNGEGVISAGGMYFDKNETRPYEYRAHPEAVQMLLDGGVDVVAVGNNHAMDYGPEALVEMVDRLEAAGIRAAGAGEAVTRAAAPVFVERNGLVVAFVGMNLTASSVIWADDDQPGVHGGKVGDADLVERLTAVLDVARAQAHLVFFTPHWGPNRATEPSAEVQDLARAVVEAGYDGVLGHSAHVIQGMELVDGKPILYDGGNMLWDSPGGAAKGQAMHFVLDLDEAGVRSVRGVPHLLGANEILAPTDEEATEIAQLWSERSAALGTEVSPDGVVPCEPGDAHEPWGMWSAAAEVRDVRTAPSRALPSSLPPEADTGITASWPELGVELVAAHLLAPELTDRGAQWVTTWWRRLDGPTPPADLEIGLAWSGDAGRDAESHLPADWMLPASSWPVGELVRDEQLLRIDQDPGGWVDFDVYLKLGADGEELTPATASVKAVRARIPIGQSVYDEDAPRLLERTPLP